MKQDIIWKHRNFWKALLALAKWLPAPKSSPITEQSVINSAKLEYCKNLEDIKKSETTLRLIVLTEQKVWDILDIEKPNSTALNIYERFISSAPITIKERDYLLWFLKDDKSRKIAQDIFSKVNLLQWNENKWAINYFLKNEGWDLSITRFVEYIIRDLEECRLIIPDDAEDIKKLWEIDNWTCYSFTANWKIWLSVVSEWKIFFLFDNLEKAKLLDNWMIFWVENFPSGMEWIPDRKKWYLYKFYDKKWFSEVHVMIGIVDLDIVESLSSELNTTFKTQNEEWKKWLLEMDKENKDEKVWDFKELLANKEEILINDKFIITTSWQEVWKINMYNTYFKQPDWLKLIANTYSETGFELIDRWDNYISIRADNKDSLYKFNEKESRLEMIDSVLINATRINITDLLNWKPTSISKNEYGIWWLGLYVFDKKTWVVTMLIKETEFLHRIESDLIKSKLNWKYFIHYWKDWVLYKLKKWYKFDPYYWGISKWFFWKNIYVHNLLEEYMKEYLEPVNVSELPVDLK